MKSDRWLPVIAFSFIYCRVSRYYSYLNSAIAILNQYHGAEPFSSFLKKFFSLQKKYGSRDRKQIAHLCYCFFRLGKDFSELEMAERILTGLFLCSPEPNELLETLKPEWNESTSLPLTTKLSLLPITHPVLAVFPWSDELSRGIDVDLFNQSFLVQPDLFLRIRPGYEKIVLEKLKNGGYTELPLVAKPVRPVGNPGDLLPDDQERNHQWMRMIGNNCIALPNSAKIEEIIELDKEAVVQDYNSQRMARYFEVLKPQTINHKLSMWDCCAGSGGKSILAKDVLGDINLSVSDIRKSILINLNKRFQKAEIGNYSSMTLDLADSTLAGRLKAHDYELILCDAPCSGSGTWSRTPEQLYFFEKQKIENFSSLQKRIVSNVIPSLKPGGYFLYVTCSVFKKENESIVDFVQEKFPLSLVEMELLRGYDKKADSMFAALFTASAS